MITKRSANDRGHIKFDWLNAHHSFSFGSYFDPNWMGFRKLRVINEDVIEQGKGFDTHPHRDMEIISFILEGELEHRDTLGHHATIKPGEIQVMSAGSGIQHSEFNPSKTDKTHMLQIWIEPSERGVKPRYEQFKYEVKDNGLSLIASAEGGNNIAKIQQDIKLSVGSVIDNDFDIKLDDKKYYWIQILNGSGSLNTEELNNGDAFAISKEKVINIKTQDQMKFLFFELS